MGQEQITLDLSNAFISPVNLQKLSANSEHCEISLPSALLDRECRVVGMSRVEFMQKFQAVWHYGSFKGCYITFEPRLKVEKKEEGAHDASAG